MRFLQVKKQVEKWEEATGEETVPMKGIDIVVLHVRPVFVISDEKAHRTLAAIQRAVSAMALSVCGGAALRGQAPHNLIKNTLRRQRRIVHDSLPKWMSHRKGRFKKNASRPPRVSGGGQTRSDSGLQVGGAEVDMTANHKADDLNLPVSPLRD